MTGISPCEQWLPRRDPRRFFPIRLLGLDRRIVRGRRHSVGGIGRGHHREGLVAPYRETNVNQ